MYCPLPQRRPRHALDHFAKFGTLDQQTQQEVDTARNAGLAEGPFLACSRGRANKLGNPFLAEPEGFNRGPELVSIHRLSVLAAAGLSPNR